MGTEGVECLVPIGASIYDLHLLELTPSFNLNPSAVF